jgi:energy-coupling factor transport system ATP-binding protein
MDFIEITELSFSYNQKAGKVIDSLSLTFSLGERIAIIGRNGAGKTTLAKLIIGMLHSQQGKIVINGKDSSKQTIATIAQQIGYVFQNPTKMLFSSSVEKELELSLQRFTLTKEEKQERIQNTLDFFNLTALQNSHPRLLSRGEKQKLALATVLIQNPKAIILDEPYSGIDLKQRGNLEEFLKKLHSQGKLIITITHDLDSVLSYYPRMIALKDGQLQYDGSPKRFFLDRTAIENIGLQNSALMAFFYSLHEKGLPKTILKKEELIEYLMSSYQKKK